MGKRVETCGGDCVILLSQLGPEHRALYRQLGAEPSRQREQEGHRP